MKHVESYTVQDLPELLDKAFYQTSSHIPITPQRAISHFNNPRAKKSDRVLWCILLNEELVAYRLLVPDVLHFEAKKLKFAWNSCLWVHPNHRGKGYGKELTHLALEEWDNKLLFVNAAPSSFALYNSLGSLRNFKINEGARYFFKFEFSQVLPVKRDFFKNFTYILKPIDQVLNFLFSKRISKQNNETNFEVIDSFQDIDFDFIRNKGEDNLLRREQKEFEWIENFPWVLESSTQNEYSKRYHFSSEKEVFQKYILRIKNGDQIAGLIFLKNIDNHYSVSYAWTIEEKVDISVNSLINFLSGKNINTLTVFDPKLRQALSKRKFNSLYEKVIIQKFMAFDGIPNWEEQSHLNFQYGDGDGVFT